MNKYTHLSDQDRKKAMLPVLTELLKIVTGEDVELSLSSTHETLLLKLGSELCCSCSIPKANYPTYLD